MTLASLITNLTYTTGRLKQGRTAALVEGTSSVTSKAALKLRRIETTWKACTQQLYNKDLPVPVQKYRPNPVLVKKITPESDLLKHLLHANKTPNFFGG